MSHLKYSKVALKLLIHVRGINVAVLDVGFF